MLDPIFFLDDPQYHTVRLGERNRVRGAVLAVDREVVERVEIDDGTGVVASANVDRDCPELASLPFPNAATSRFECECRFEVDRIYELRGRHTNGEVTPLFSFSTAADGIERSRQIAQRVARLPLPPPDLVEVTQGGRDTNSYLDSAVSGFGTLAALLRRSGHDVEPCEQILDVGCGTGRLLLAWHADRPSRRLVGVDLNASLIEWAQGSLGEVATWKVSGLLPPLDLEEQSFDLVQLASVFTHLPSEHQGRWVEEIRRLLKPGGAAVITLHGDIYARVLLDEPLQRQYAASGYAEVAGAEPGANAFATFHSREFAANLFRSFRRVDWYESGSTPEKQRLFPIAALQDVYVLTR